MCKHIDDVQKDINYLSANISIFTETRFSSHDANELYAIEGYELFRNDEISNFNRPYHGTAVYSRLPMLNGYLLCEKPPWDRVNYLKNSPMSRLNCNWNIQIPKVCALSLLLAICTTLDKNPSSLVIFTGDFNVN